MKKIIIKLSILILLLLLFWGLLTIKDNPSASEFFARYISSTYISFAAMIFGSIPFSVYEFILISFGIFIVYYVIRFVILLCKKKIKLFFNTILNCSIFVFIFVNLYTSTASISYGRQDVKIPQYNETVNQSLIDNAFEYFLNDYNTISTHFEREEDGSIKNPYTFNELNKILKKEFEKLDPTYFPSYTPDVKQLTFSRIFSELHFTGIFWALTGEANVNRDCHPVELPHVMAHEIAHSKGVFREDDANLVALYITLTSENEFLRYSAYYAGFSSLLNIYRLTDYDKYYHSYFRLNEDIRREYVAVSKFWQSHDLLAKIGEWYNNLFLILNGNKNGTGDYIDKEESEDSGNKDEDDRPIYIITEYSPYQKLFFQVYQDTI